MLVLAVLLVLGGLWVSRTGDDGLDQWLANWIITESDGDITFERDEPGGAS